MKFVNKQTLMHDAMESYNTSAFDTDQMHPVVDDVYTNDGYSGQYREPNNFNTEEFDNLGGLHYMNYLHANDDML